MFFLEYFEDKFPNICKLTNDLNIDSELSKSNALIFGKIHKYLKHKSNNY